jgi:SAM-dependent methyltransferase
MINDLRGGWMEDRPDWVPAGVDTRRANIARVYDYLLGGRHNFLADQDAARALAAVEPRVRAFARANREFLGAAVRYVCEAGIRQFLDIGSGIPTGGNVHEIAQEAGPGSRVAYADIDPVAVAHSTALLAGRADTVVIQADLREPGRILGDPAVRRLIDLTQPVGLLLVSVLPFIADAEDPWQAVAALRDALAPGSYLVVCHGTYEDRPAVTQALDKVYKGSVQASGGARSRADILRFFDGLDLVDPGLVYVGQWRPGPHPDAADHRWGLAGVGRKP